MSITNSSAARRAGFKINNKSVSDEAAISMAKIGTRTLRFPLPSCIWVMSGTSVAIGEDGIFPVITLPNANSGNLYTSFRLLAEWVSGNDISINIYWKSSGVSGNVKFTVALASKTVGETTASSNTQTVTTAAQTTAGKVQKSTVTFSNSLFAAGDIIGINILRDPTDVDDTLTSDISFIGAEAEYTGRG